MMSKISVPDVLGFEADEALEILRERGFTVSSVEIARPVHGGQPEGGCRVIRLRASGQDVKLVLSFQKWVWS